MKVTTGAFMSKFNEDEGNQNREDLEMESQDNQNIQGNQNREDLEMESQDNQNRRDLEMESQDNQNIQGNQNREDLGMESQDNQNIQNHHNDEGLDIDSQYNQNTQNNHNDEGLELDFQYTQENQEQEGLGIKVSRLIETAENIVSQTKKAIQETIQEIETSQNPINTPQLKCIRNGVLDFKLLEKDIKPIHQQIELDEEAKVLGSYLVILQLEDIKFEVKVETYLQKQSKTLMQSVQAKVSNFYHLPLDVVNELKANKEVKLFLGSV